MRPAVNIRYYPQFLGVIPEPGAGCPRVTHPFATRTHPEEWASFDLHVLSTPPAFVLSQDQTLRRCLTPGREPRPDRSRYQSTQRNPTRNTPKDTPGRG